METLLCRLASWRVRFASMRVWMVALLISDCKKLSLLERSGLVWTAAYCKLPIKPGRANFSSGVTSAVSLCFLSGAILIGSILLTYRACDMVMLLSECWAISIPVNVNWPILWDPKGYVLSHSCNLERNGWLPPHSPSSTWTPIIPSGFLITGSQRMKVQGQNGGVSNSNLTNSSRRAWYQRNGASIRP